MHYGPPPSHSQGDDPYGAPPSHYQGDDPYAPNPPQQQPPLQQPPPQQYPQQQYPQQQYPQQEPYYANNHHHNGYDDNNDYDNSDNYNAYDVPIEGRRMYGNEYDDQHHQHRHDDDNGGYYGDDGQYYSYDQNNNQGYGQQDDEYYDEDGQAYDHEDHEDDRKSKNGGRCYKDDEEEDDHHRQDEYEEDEVGQEQAPPRREFKYSTANMSKSSGKCRICWICLLFVLFILITIGFSMLMDHLFFGGVSDNAPATPERSANDTFPEEKMFVDQSCSTGTLAVDGGERCTATCEPAFFECCDPFDEFDLYNITRGQTGDEIILDLNSTLAGNETDLSECSLDKELRGCMSYAKCQALSGDVDPAPASLPFLCNAENLKRDPESCQSLCKRVECCFSREDNCLAKDFAICSDYSPCQNLRSTATLETAPHDLDQVCLWETSECFEWCEKAECCGDPESRCFEDNFMTCLTYAPCVNVTNVEIPVTPQFSYMEAPTKDLYDACREDPYVLGEPMDKPTCMDLCHPASCCWGGGGQESCFRQDPLGCLAYKQQCQILFSYE